MGRALGRAAEPGRGSADRRSPDALVAGPLMLLWPDEAPARLRTGSGGVAPHATSGSGGQQVVQFGREEQGGVEAHAGEMTGELQRQDAVEAGPEGQEPVEGLG